MYDCVWLCMAVYGYVWLCRAVYGCVWLCMAMYGCVWLCMATCGYLGLCMAVYGCVWLWMSVYSYVCPYRPARRNYSGRFMGHTWITNPFFRQCRSQPRPQSSSAIIECDVTCGAYRELRPGRLANNGNSNVAEHDS